MSTQNNDQPAQAGIPMWQKVLVVPVGILVWEGIKWGGKTIYYKFTAPKAEAPKAEEPKAEEPKA